VQINTTLRPCPPIGEGEPLKPLSPEEILRIEELFKPLKVYSVYDVKRPETSPMDEKEARKRRPES
jgi:hypothetical protein